MRGMICHYTSSPRFTTRVAPGDLWPSFVLREAKRRIYVLGWVGTAQFCMDRPGFCLVLGLFGGRGEVTAC